MHKIALSMEVPTALLSWIDPFIDSHFIIATEALKDPDYLNFYKEYNRKPEHKLTFLDNGMYEEGKPLSPKELLEVALEIQPDIVFAPDIVGDREATLALTKQFLHIAEEINLKAEIGLIPQGRNIEEIIKCHDQMIRLPINYPGPIGLSFLNDRRELIKQLKFSCYRSYHFLGLYDFEEIEEWPHQYIMSMDTVKPFKAAYYEKSIRQNCRGLGKWNTRMRFDREKQDLMFLHNLTLLHAKLTRQEV